MFGVYRLAGQLPTRRPSERPKTIKVDLIKNDSGERDEQFLSLSDYPFISAVLPELDPAGILSGLPSTEVFRAKIWIANLVRPNAHTNRWNSEGKQAEISRTLKITEFTRMLAKIAHSFAVAELGYDSFDWYLPNIILGKSLYLPDYVGSDKGSAIGEGDFLGNNEETVSSIVEHSLCCEDYIVSDGDKYLTVAIKLLRFSGPTYRVVVAQYDQR
jgi:hypothetical protein